MAFREGTPYLVVLRPSLRIGALGEGPGHECRLPSTRPSVVEFVNTGAFQEIYRAFPVTGGIRQHPRRGNSLDRCCAVDSQVDRGL